jgi:hypothetical protein
MLGSLSARRHLLRHARWALLDFVFTLGFTLCHEQLGSQDSGSATT